MLRIPFTKMEGASNDFVVIDDREDVFVGREEDLAQRLCDRRNGIGADGIIFVRKPPEGADCTAEMVYYNADGSFAGMCGNGLRCTALFVSRWLENQPESLNICAGGVPHLSYMKYIPGSTARDEAVVGVDIAVPELEVEFIPANVAGPQFIGRPLQLAPNFTAECTLVSMGNPHCVMWLEDISDELVSEIGPKVEHSPLFPEGVNVGFSRMAGNQIELRVWERGCGETLACGSGACAAVVSAMLTGRIPYDQPVTVRMRGGMLYVGWAGEGHKCILTGPARIVFEGKIGV